jgi:hypothetical protein
VLADFGGNRFGGDLRLLAAAARQDHRELVAA